MFNSNHQIINFVSSNYLLLLIFAALLVRCIPAEWAGFWKYNNNDEAQGRAPRLTALHFILATSLQSVVQAFLVPFTSAFGVKNTVTMIIFITVTYGVFIQHEISTQVVTLVSVGVVSLYLESLLENGKSLSLFGIIHWERRETIDALPRQ